MTVRRLLRILAAASGALISSWGIAGLGSAQTRAAGISAHGELIYIANVNESNDPVIAYAAGSADSVAPARRLDNPNASGTVWDPWGVTFDAGGNLYVQSFLSSADTFVFQPVTAQFAGLASGGLRVQLLTPARDALTFAKARFGSTGLRAVRSWLAPRPRSPDGGTHARRHPAR